MTNEDDCSGRHLDTLSDISLDPDDNSAHAGVPDHIDKQHIKSGSDDDCITTEPFTSIETGPSSDISCDNETAKILAEVKEAPPTPTPTIASTVIKASAAKLTPANEPGKTNLVSDKPENVLDENNVQTPTTNQRVPVQESNDSNLDDGDQTNQESTQSNGAVDSNKDKSSAAANTAAGGIIQCPYCKKEFTRPSSLSTHIYTHTGEKPHECTFPGCKKRFSVLSNLRRHLKLHKKQQILLDEVNSRNMRFPLNRRYSINICQQQQLSQQGPHQLQSSTFMSGINPSNGGGAAVSPNGTWFASPSSYHQYCESSWGQDYSDLVRSGETRIPIYPLTSQQHAAQDIGRQQYVPVDVSDDPGKGSAIAGSTSQFDSGGSDSGRANLDSKNKSFVNGCTQIIPRYNSSITGGICGRPVEGITRRASEMIGFDSLLLTQPLNFMSSSNEANGQSELSDERIKRRKTEPVVNSEDNSNSYLNRSAVYLKEMRPAADMIQDYNLGAMSDYPQMYDLVSYQCGHGVSENGNNTIGGSVGSLNIFNSSGYAPDLGFYSQNNFISPKQQHNSNQDQQQRQPTSVPGFHGTQFFTPTGKEIKQISTGGSGTGSRCGAEAMMTNNTTNSVTNRSASGNSIGIDSNMMHSIAAPFLNTDQHSPVVSAHIPNNCSNTAESAITIPEISSFDSFNHMVGHHSNSTVNSNFFHKLQNN
ncbi:hypothetical protein H4219_003578 [Mycoemilia scoparia]|uniref:C2H2-type domain-containing protein n=1 Tax=Mycoemilia scoparia TaxID=417184 RepID=A0A9W7ZYF8_9FUNG|nr:hypothetical protein H4219_003578 [Mycoemilia scoparia]